MISWKTGICGAIAGAINGLLGAGGGMVLVPLLDKSGEFEQRQIFPSSVSIILPLCSVSLLVSSLHGQIPWKEALPYLIGSVPGGLLAGVLGKKFSVKWLHRALGAIILWGGIRYLW